MKKVALIFSLICSTSCALNAQEAVVSAEKMNVFYMGVDNPIAVSVPNVSSDKLKVTGENVESITKQSDGYYSVRVFRLGEATIIIEANGKTTKKKFRVKQLPDPIVILSNGRGSEGRGDMNVDNFKVVQGLIATFANLDFDARCSVQSFVIAISSKKGDAYFETINGSSFSINAAKRIQMLEIGDVVSISEIKIRCPGDPAARNLGSLTYTMK
jgi:GldM C-terminal domain